MPTFTVKSVAWVLAPATTGPVADVTELMVTPVTTVGGGGIMTATVRSVCADEPDGPVVAIGVVITTCVGGGKVASGCKSVGLSFFKRSGVGWGAGVPELPG